MQPQHVFHAVEQFQLVDGLAEKIVGAGLDRPFDVAQRVQRGDHQDHDVTGGRVALELLADLKPTQLWHHHVEQDQVRLERRHLIQRIASIDGGLDLAIDVAQIRLDQFNVRLVIVGDEDTALAVVRFSVHSFQRPVVLLRS